MWMAVLTPLRPTEEEITLKNLGFKDDCKDWLLPFVSFIHELVMLIPCKMLPAQTDTALWWVFILGCGWVRHHLHKSLLREGNPKRAQISGWRPRCFGAVSCVFLLRSRPTSVSIIFREHPQLMSLQMGVSINGVPLVIIHLRRVFPYKPSIWGIPQFMETPFIYHY